MPKSVSITNDSRFFPAILLNLVDAFTHFAQSFDFRQNRNIRFSSSHIGRFKSYFNHFPRQRVFKISTVVIIILLLIFLVNFFINPSNSKSVEQSSITIAEPTATATLNTTFSFPLKDSTGQEIAQLKYEILSAELRNEIIVKGQRARTVKGRTFLILNLKITNEFNQAVEIDSRDYVRLIFNGNNAEKLAPEIHNDPVEVQAISVKNTRLGFTINSQFDQLTLQVGEINGDKQTLDLNLI